VLTFAALWLGRASATAQANLTLLELTSSEPGEVAHAIELLGQSHEPHALELLEALREGTLRIDSAGRAYEARGSVLHALDGQGGAATSSALSTPVLTNTTRRALARALSTLELRAPDVSTRLRAAQALGRAPEISLSGTMRKAFSRETNPEVRAQLALALAQLDLASDDPGNRYAGVKALAESGALHMKPRLEALLASDSAGKPLEPDAEVRKAAQDALAALSRKELMLNTLRDLFYGASLGSILLLVALGLAITFGLMGVINMAHGEMLMLGAYTTYVVQTLFQRYLPEYQALYLPCALPCAFILCMVVGIAIERSVIRLLYGRPLESLLATWGVSLVLVQAVRLTFGAANVTVKNPVWLSGGYELMEGVVLPYPRIATVAFCALVAGFVWWLLYRTRLGLHVRAITQNRSMAGCMGVRTARVDMLTFGVGSGLAGLGGVALSQLGNVGPELGQLYIVDSFMVVVVGGVGKLVGTVVTSLSLGFINKLLEPFAGAVLGKILVLGFVILFIQRRPQGLFAQKGRAAEA
jgi:urea transport system permease protein